MHFITTFTATVAAFALGTNAFTVPHSNTLTKREETAEDGQKCDTLRKSISPITVSENVRRKRKVLISPLSDNLVEKRCNGAHDFVMQCLGAPGDNANFQSGGIIPCDERSVCIGGGCQVDSEKIKKIKEAEEKEESSLTSTLVPSPSPSADCELGM